MKHVNNTYIWLFAVIFIVSIVGIVFITRPQQSIHVPTIKQDNPTTLPTPTPFPFSELTIPYLRNRVYESSLTELKEVNRNSTYTSYITSYDSDGLTIQALLTKPQNNQPNNGFPAIVFVHGYIPPKQYVTQEQYASFVDYFARNGFVVLKIDLRGHGNSEGEPGGAYYSSDYVIDTLNAYAALQSVPFVNPQAIGLWGHSMAGNIVLRSAATRTSIPAVVIWAGAVYTYTDFIEYGIQDSSYQPPANTTERIKKREELFKLYGQPTKESMFWQQMAPATFIIEYKGAIQMHHAVNDPVVSIKYSRNLKQILENTTVPHELMEYASGGHNIEGSSFSQAMKQSTEFFRKYLQSQ